MTDTILFRSDFSDDVEEELQIAHKYLPCATSRVNLPNQRIVGRYSVLPYYKELEQDLKLQGSTLINSHRQHRFIADFEWYHVVKDLTPETWFRLNHVPQDEGPFVVKGTTNSRKFEWSELMYAENFKKVLDIEGKLAQDGLIGGQGVVVRRYVPLKVLEYGLYNLPFANEWRFFYLGNTKLAHGFYWTASQKRGTINQEGLAFAQQVADRIKDYANFFVLDIAEKAAGGWTLIEVNDGQMAGLSDCSPEELYSNLATELSRFQNE